MTLRGGINLASALSRLNIKTGVICQSRDSIGFNYDHDSSGF